MRPLFDTAKLWIENSKSCFFLYFSYDGIGKGFIFFDVPAGESKPLPIIG